MTSLKGDLRSIMGTPFGGVGHAVLIFSRVTRAAFDSDSVILQLHDRIEMPEEADGKFRIDGLDPGPIRIELEGGTVHNHGWNIDLPDEGVWSLTDLVDAQVDWSPAVIGRAEAAAREARDHADRAEAGADRVGTAEQVGVWASEASASASAADSARSDAVAARNASQSARDAAEGHANRAAASESNAAASESAAKQSETNAGDYAAVATTAATEAVDAMDSISWYKGIFPTNANLDEYTSSGYWGMPGTAAARRTIQNTPGGTQSPGVLTVTRSGVSDPFVFHHFTEWTSDGAVLSTRMQVGGAWTGWKAQKDWERGVIARNTDLNNCKTPGVYVMPHTSALRGTVANTPSPSAIGVLTVTSSAQVTFQEFIYWTSEKPVIARRQAVIDTWTAWTEDKPSSNVEVAKWLPTQPIKVWGDSLVEGGDFNGVWEAGESLPERIGALVDTQVINEGISGQTSNDILVRAGAIEMIGLPEGGMIPASGTVNVDMVGQAWDTRANRKSLPVYWAGVRGGLYLTSSGWTFTRSSSGDPVAVTAPEIFKSVNGEPGATGTHIFIMGENDFAYGHGPEKDMASHIIANYERAIESVAHSPHRHVLVAGIKTRVGQKYDDLQPQTVRKVNDHLRRKYPLYYVDRMGWLLSRGMEAIGLTPTPAEQAEISQGILPARLFATNDTHHIRKEVLEAEARELWAPRLVRQGWAKLKPGTDLPVIENTPVDDLRSNAPVALASAGSPEGKISGPVGAPYTDTAATNGAIRWIKTSDTGNTGWRVEYGDTGWRDVTGLLINGWTADAVLIRRHNQSVSLRYKGLTGDSATSGRMMHLPPGFFTSRTRLVFTGAVGVSIAQIGTNGELDLATSFSDPSSNYWSDTTWTTFAGWPTTLTGTPA